ncbi:HAD-IIB family hydrolase [Spiroplasma endosymbiont of Othius punctulatus]|uniref:HAD-IIB family hydrolase n=1 Tax=Spiroplasma endosymbiont of Othius punctulatus TaxID=3066289 RepID=UPI0030D1D6D3
MKWLFTDFDNTVEIPADHETTEKNFEFLKKWNEAGNRVVFASGRPVEMLEKSSKDAGLESEYFISNNGAYTYDKHLKKLDQVFISSEHRSDMLKILNDEAAKGACIIYILPNGRQGYSYIDIKNYPYGGFEKVKDFFFPNGINEQNKEKDILENKELLSIYFLGNLEFDFEGVAKKFDGFKNIRAIRTAPVILEIVPYNVSKARGIEIISKLHNIDTKDIYTSGDGDNDKEMLENYDNSYAMNHGTDVAKKSAKNIITHLYDLEKFK